jgi:protease I
MADQKLNGTRVAILATDGFEESELFEPLHALEKAGAEIQIISLKRGSIKSWNKQNWGREIPVTATVADVKADDFDALMLPGGVMNPDHLRMDEKAVAFVKGFVDAGKPMAAICHGPWTLIEAGAVQGRQMTSWPSLKTDLMNAGANWVDQEVVTDNGLVTSRMPKDLPAFCAKMIEEFAEGPHDVMQTAPATEAQVQDSLH